MTSLRSESQSLGNPLNSKWRGVINMLIVALGGLVLVGLGAGQLVFLSLAAAIMAVTLWPFANTDVLVFSPWGVVTVNVALAVFARGVFIATRYPSGEIVDELFLRGKSDDFFLWPTFLILGTIIIAIAGYLHGLRRGKRVRSWLLDATWSSSRLIWIVTLLGLAAIAGVVLFIRATSGGVSDLFTSTKRVRISGLQLDESYQSFGQFRYIADFGRLALLLFAAHIFHARRAVSRRQWLALASLFVVSAALPFYASSRTGALWIIVELGTLWVLAGRTVKLRTIAIIGLAVLLGFQLMTSARGSGEITSLDIALASPPGESAVLTRNMLGIAKTAHVINAVGQELEPAYGRTIVAWIAAPVPRQLWPGKPLIQAGPEVGIKVFGNRFAGVPPGLVADLYWNLGAAGVFVGSYVAFLLVGWWQRRLSPFQNPSPARSVLYITTLFTPTWVLLGTGLGAAIFTALDGLVALLLIVALTYGARVRCKRGAA